jgi:hypothetical protein
MNSNALVENTLLNNAMCCSLSLMTELNPQLERYLPQRSFGALCQLYNFSYGRFCLRVFAQLFDIRFRVFAPCDIFSLLSWPLNAPPFWSALVARKNMLASYVQKLPPSNVIIRHRGLTTADAPTLYHHLGLHWASATLF